MAIADVHVDASSRWGPSGVLVMLVFFLIVGDAGGNQDGPSPKAVAV